MFPGLVIWNATMHAKKMWSMQTVCCVCGYQQLLVNVVYGLRLVLHEILTKIAEHMKHFMIQKLKFQVVMKYFTLCSTIFHAQTLDVSFHIPI